GPRARAASRVWWRRRGCAGFARRRVGTRPSGRARRRSPRGVRSRAGSVLVAVERDRLSHEFLGVDLAADVLVLDRAGGIAGASALELGAVSDALGIVGALGALLVADRHALPPGPGACQPSRAQMPTQVVPRAAAAAIASSPAITPRSVCGARRACSCVPTRDSGTSGMRATRAAAARSALTRPSTVVRS